MTPDAVPWPLALLTAAVLIGGARWAHLAWRDRRRHAARQRLRQALEAAYVDPAASALPPGWRLRSLGDSFDELFHLLGRIVGHDRGWNLSWSVVLSQARDAALYRAFRVEIAPLRVMPAGKGGDKGSMIGQVAKLHDRFSHSGVCRARGGGGLWLAHKALQ